MVMFWLLLATDFQQTAQESKWKTAVFFFWKFHFHQNIPNPFIANSYVCVALFPPKDSLEEGLSCLKWQALRCLWHLQN